MTTPSSVNWDIMMAHFGITSHVKNVANYSRGCDQIATDLHVLTRDKRIGGTLMKPMHKTIWQFSVLPAIDLWRNNERSASFHHGNGARRGQTPRQTFAFEGG